MESGVNVPEDPELKNIIDKLANFVARNGSDFEIMTKEKQRDNPKFSFLFGGPAYAYYQMKLSTERQYMARGDDKNPDQMNQQYPPWKQPSSQQGYSQYSSPHPPMRNNVPPWQRQPMPMYSQEGPPMRGAGPMSENQHGVGQPNYPPQPAFDKAAIDATEVEIRKLEDDIALMKTDVHKQVQQSRSNLDQQYEVLMAKQEENIEKEIEKAQIDELKQMSYSTGIALIEFDAKLTPIIKSCTKDSISNGKAFILTHGKTIGHCDVLTGYILQRMTEIDKENNGEKTPEKFEKQLHIIYLINDVLHHSSRKNLLNIIQSIGKKIVPIFCTASVGLLQTDPRKEKMDKLLGLWGKFGYFDDNTIAKLKEPENSLVEYQANLLIEHSDIVKAAQKDIESQYDQFRQQHEQYAKHVSNNLDAKRDELLSKIAKCEEMKKREHEREAWKEPPWSQMGGEAPQMGKYDYDQGPARGPPPEQMGPEYNQRRSNWGPEPGRPVMGGEWGPREPPPWNNNMGPRPNFPPPADWQRPPRPPMPMPGINPNDPALIPTAPYYELPVGLMCPLVKLEETEFKPLDPTLIRLPPPIPPSDRLLAALDAFYSPPSRDRPRNLDGWEQMGLYEFFRAKVQAKRKLENKTDRSPRDRRSRRSRSYSRSRSKSYSRSRSLSSSRSRSRSYSRSRSRSYSRSRSRSLSRSTSKTPPRAFTRAITPTKHKEPITTPRQSRFSAMPIMPVAEPGISTDSPGAEIMKKMGWAGAGLGSSEQGRKEPVKGGEVRDKIDQFKGLGMPQSDPFESFRKSKSQGFIARIKSRAELGD